MPEDAQWVFIYYNGRRVEYETDGLDEVSTACATTVLKRRSSQYPAVVIEQSTALAMAVKL